MRSFVLFGFPFSLIVLGLFLISPVVFGRSYPECWHTDQHRLEEAYGLMEKGRQFADSGENELSLPVLKKALALFRDLSDSAGVAHCLLDLGNVYVHLEQSEMAIPCYAEAENIFKSKGDEEGARICRHNSAKASFQSGQYGKALPVFREMKDTLHVASCLRNMGDEFFKCDSFEKAIDVYQEAQELFHMIRKPGELALCQRNTGVAYIRLGHPQKALTFFEEAVTYYRHVGDSLQIATVFQSIGQALHDLRKYVEAIDAFGEAADIFYRCGELKKEALCRRNLGSIDIDLYRFTDALEQFTRAAQCCESVGDKEGQALCLKTLGDINCNLCRSSMALNQYSEALELFRFLEKREDEIACHRGYGRVYLTWGKIEEALSSYESALKLARRLSEPTLIGQCMKDLGDAYFEIGLFDEALKAFEQCLALLEQTGDYAGQANCLMSLGNLYLELGRTNKAIEAFIRAEDMYKRRNDLSGRESCSVSLGNVYYELGKYDDALTHYQEAMEIARSIWDFKGESIARINIGNIYSSEGRLMEALHEYDEALGTCRAIKFPEGEALCHNNSAGVSMKRGDTVEAMAAFRRAQRILQECKIIDELSTVLSNIGVLFENESMIDSACYYYTAAVRQIETIRSGLDRRKILKSYVEKKADLYDRLISALLQLNRPEEAYQYLQRLKSENLIQALDAGEMNVPDRALGDDLTKIDELDEQIKRLEKKLLDEKSQPEGKKNSERIEELNKQVASKMGEMHDLGAKIRTENPDYIHLVQVATVRPDRIQAFLPEGALMVEYYPGDRMVSLFVITSDQFHTLSVPVSRDSLYSLIKRFRGFFKTCTHAVNGKESVPFLSGEMANVLTSLYSILIRPLAGTFARSTTVIVVPSGLLYYVPFQVLASPKADGTLEYVLEQKRICYLTDCMILDVLSRMTERTRTSLRILAFGDPDETLPGAFDEVHSIKAIYPQTRVYTHQEACEGRAVTGSCECNVLHLATHAHLIEEEPSESYIKLAQDEEHDGKWKVSEILGMNWPHMDLVTLSACETAVGVKEPGREVEALAYAFATAGARAVVATQWPVFDPSTKLMMEHFYRNLQSMDTIEALRQAQLKLLQNQTYSHPFYWGPFLLIGGWQ